MNIPEELKYTREHEWVKLNDDNTAYVGITDFAQGELGDLIYVDVYKDVDEVVVKDDVFGVVEAVKTVSDLFMPVIGKLLEINPFVLTNPEFISEDPYHNWIIKIELVKPEEYDALLTSEQYKNLIGQ